MSQLLSRVLRYLNVRVAIMTPLARYRVRRTVVARHPLDG
jgi:hypothetical protein